MVASQLGAVRVFPGVLVGALSEHYGSPGRLAEYRRQFERASRSPGDDPSVFAVELETLAWRVFADVNASVHLQLVRHRFIAGQAECSLRRHLDSWGRTLLFGTLWTVAACGRVMPKTQTVGEVATSRNVLGRSTRW